MLGSRNLLEHIVRGLVGAAAFAGAYFLAKRGGALDLVGAAMLVIIALIAWRGCPLCWLTGLFSTPRR
jgi:hypothetical protein